MEQYFYTLTVHCCLDQLVPDHWCVFRFAAFCMCCWKHFCVFFFPKEKEEDVLFFP